MKVYDSLPQASVIITFVEHETLSYLLHTIHSIVQRTPPELLKEIILVDDNSTKGKYVEMWLDEMVRKCHNLYDVSHILQCI